MKKLLILYPAEFKCRSKFDRKISKILSQLTDYCVVYPYDFNNYISSFFSTSLPLCQYFEDGAWKDCEITHAIVFDDGEVFLEEISFIENSGIKLRKIDISITRVINIKKEISYQNIKSTPKYEYIGRGSYWGNPYSMYEAGEDRDEVIRKYKYDFDHEKFPNKNKSEVYKLAGKRLGCFCKPQTCHGDILADFLNSWDDLK